MKGRSATCRWSRATPTTSRSSRPTSPATRTTNSVCRASTPTARRCTPTTCSTATPTPRRTAPACACCRYRRSSSARSRSSPTASPPSSGRPPGWSTTPSRPPGTNDLHGSTSFRFRRNAMSSKPFFLAPTARKPDTEVNDFNAAAGGPIVRDKLHFFGAYEYVDRSLITGSQVITVDPSAAQELGITLPESGVIPAHQKVNFMFGKADYQVDTANRLSVRYFLFKNSSASNIAGGLTTPEQRHRFHRSHGLGLGPARLDARRLQAERGPRAVRAAPSVPHAGGHRSRRSRDHRFERRQLRRSAPGRHEFGRLRLQPGHLAGDRQPDLAARTSTASRPASTRSSSPTIASAASSSSTRSRTTPPTSRRRAGTDPFGYTTLQQLFGQLDASYNSAFYGSSCRTTGKSTAG